MTSSWHWGGLWLRMTSKFEDVVLSQKRCPCQVRHKLLPWVEEFKYLRACSQVWGKWSRTSTWCSVSSDAALLWWRELSVKVWYLIYWSVHVCTLICGHELSTGNQINQSENRSSWDSSKGGSIHSIQFQLIFIHITRTAVVSRCFIL